MAASAMQEAIAESNYYADPENHELRQALAAKHDVDIDEICVDAGIDSLLGLTVRMLLEPGQTVVTSHGAYPTLNYHVAGFGANLVTVPYKNFHEDPDALVAASAEHSAKLVYIANPDNPMGTWHSAGYPLSNLFKGLRYGGPADRLRYCPQRSDHRLQQN